MIASLGFQDNIYELVDELLKRYHQLTQFEALKIAVQITDIEFKMELPVSEAIQEVAHGLNEIARQLFEIDHKTMGIDELSSAIQSVAQVLDNRLS